MTALIYIIEQYFLAAVMATSIFGMGILSMSIVKLITQDTQCTEISKSILFSIGIGAIICCVQILLISGQFNQYWIYIIAISGSVACLHYFSSQPRNPFKQKIQLSISQGILLLSISLTFLAPLSIPKEWDELMYHLPHAMAWAENQALTINENYRYPFFPYNFNLLYTAVLSIKLNTMPHFLHAMAGWATAGIIHNYVSEEYGKTNAALSVFLWIAFSYGQFESAYIDLGLTLFCTAALFSIIQWIKKKGIIYLYLAAFFSGLALGTKYQAVIYLFAIAISIAPFLFKSKTTTRQNIIAAILLLTPMIYWYLRNFIITGNPVNPLAANIFGHYDWNAGDLKAQFEDLQRVRKNAIPYITIAAIAFSVVFFQKNKKLSLESIPQTFLLIATILWTIVSGYPRYLLPALPAMSVSIVTTTSTLFKKNRRITYITTSYKTYISVAIIITLIIFSAIRNTKSYQYIPHTEEIKENLLRKYIDGYEGWALIKNQYHGKVYQVGFDGMLYYAPPQTYGDVFGPWRYNDYVKLSPLELQTKLINNNFTHLSINKNFVPAEWLEKIEKNPLIFTPIFNTNETGIFIIHK